MSIFRYIGDNKYIDFVKCEYWHANFFKCKFVDMNMHVKLFQEGTERTKLGEEMDQGQGVNGVVVKRGRGKGRMVKGLKNQCPGSEG